MDLSGASSEREQDSSLQEKSSVASQEQVTSTGSNGAERRPTIQKSRLFASLGSQTLLKLSKEEMNEGEKKKKELEMRLLAKLENEKKELKLKAEQEKRDVLLREKQLWNEKKVFFL